MWRRKMSRRKLAGWMTKKIKWIEYKKRDEHRVWSLTHDGGWPFIKGLIRPRPWSVISDMKHKFYVFFHTKPFKKTLKTRRVKSRLFLPHNYVFPELSSNYRWFQSSPVRKCFTHQCIDQKWSTVIISRGHHVHVWSRLRQNLLLWAWYRRNHTHDSAGIYWLIPFQMKMTKMSIIKE